MNCTLANSRPSGSEMEGVRNPVGLAMAIESGSIPRVHKIGRLE